ncbi:hypothetical protein BpHYR1_019616 [Brachionus plicatilis]|uniref:Uncharacterized protein n=1 Tax=Brachionus plicatilis TaxID=10195 RepID=A0A3M7QS03_BRAPC|nr:hypothetical protein BpHYR1_019616 [Brachionus plicatilis]
MSLECFADRKSSKKSSFKQSKQISNHGHAFLLDFGEEILTSSEKIPLRKNSGEKNPVEKIPLRKNSSGKKSIVLQIGSNDCGLFSIAYAYELSRKRDPSNIQYDQLGIFSTGFFSTGIFSSGIFSTGIFSYLPILNEKFKNEAASGPYQIHNLMFKKIT